MKEKAEIQSADTSTEEKIKNAARNIFHKKGYAATRTRDIAEEAGINLALLNYYFRSKEKLFDLIMLESLHRFKESLTGTLNNPNTSLDDKIEQFVHNYIDLLIYEPNIPVFILSELRTNPDELLAKINFKEFLMQSYFVKQMQQALAENQIAPIHPMHLIMNIIGMTVFPFIAKPIVTNLGDLAEEDFNTLMQQRKKLIPQWVKSILATT